jgi:hypothetical protein
VLVDNFDQRKEFRKREICLHCASKCTMLGLRGPYEN